MIRTVYRLSSIFALLFLVAALPPIVSADELPLTLPNATINPNAPPVFAAPIGNSPGSFALLDCPNQDNCNLVGGPALVGSPTQLNVAWDVEVPYVYNFVNLMPDGTVTSSQVPFGFSLSDDQGDAIFGEVSGGTWSTQGNNAVINLSFPITQIVGHPGWTVTSPAGEQVFGTTAPPAFYVTFDLTCGSTPCATVGDPNVTSVAATFSTTAPGTTSTPEPATLALFGSGLLLVALAMRRLSRHKAAA